jgi:hypothetical protein
MNRPAAQARHWTRLVRVAVPVVVFAVSAFIFVARPLLGQRAYMSVDILELNAPYRDAIGHPAHVVSPTQGDQVEQFGPAEIMSDRSLEDREWQTWDPHIAAGTPAGIPPLTANVAPFNWTFFFVPAWYAVGLSAALAILVCQGFMYLFLRRLGAAMLPAIVGAIAYSYTGTNIVFINRLWAPFLLPALLWAVHRLVDKPTFPAGLALGGFVAWAWYEGFPSAWVYCMATTVAFAAVLLVARWLRMGGSSSPGGDGRARQRWALRRVAMLGFGLAWGVALSALTLIPFVHEVSGRDVLAARSTDSTSHLDSINVLGLLTSEVPGPPARGPWWTGVAPFEGTSYLGLTAIAIVAIGLLLASLRRFRASSDGSASFAFFSVVGVLVIVLCYIGTPLLGLAYRLPGFANNPIWRMRFLIGFAAAVLLALTLDSLWRHGLRLVRNGAVLMWISRVTLVAAAAILIWHAPHLFDVGAAGARSDLLRNAGVTIGVLLVVLAAVRWPKLVITAAVVAGVAIYLELILPGYDFTPAAPKSDFFTEQSGHRTLKRLTDGRFRYAASSRNFSWNTSQVFGLYDLRGAALHAPEFRQLMNEVSVESFARDTFKIQLFRDEWNLASPILDHLGVRYFALGTDDVPYGTPDREVATPTEWVATDAGRSIPVSGDVGRIDGVIVPLRAMGSCTTGAVRVRLTRDGVTTSTSRPLYDVNGTPLTFAIRSPGDVPAALSLDVRATNPRCRVETGVGADASFAGALLHIDDGAPVSLASTNQAWIYERPAASPIVTSYGQWKRFATQPEALEWLRSRPANEADVVPVVGNVPRSAAAGEAANVVETHIGDESVTARVAGATPSLVSGGQVVGDGWNVTIDGKPSEMVLIDGGIMATPVPPGNHVVKFRYAPGTVRAGALLSVCAVLVAGVGLLALGIRRARSSRPRSRGGPDVTAGAVTGDLERSRDT